MRCPYCKFRISDEDQDVLMKHIEERHPRVYRKRYVKHPDDVQAEIEDDEYEDTSGSSEA